MAADVARIVTVRLGRATPSEWGIGIIRATLGLAAAAAPAATLLRDLAFCPVCGESRAQRQFGDQYACLDCGRAGELTGWT